MTTTAAFVFVIVIALVNFEERFFNKNMYFLALFVFGRLRRMSMAMNASAYVAVNKRDFNYFIMAYLFGAHDLNSFSVPYTSSTICGP